jgi:hypothetical protein
LMLRMSPGAPHAKAPCASARALTRRRCSTMTAFPSSCSPINIWAGRARVIHGAWMCPACAERCRVSCGGIAYRRWRTNQAGCSSVTWSRILTLLRLPVGRPAPTSIVGSRARVAVTVMVARSAGFVPGPVWRSCAPARSTCVTRRAAPPSGIWSVATRCVRWCSGLRAMRGGSVWRPVARAGSRAEVAGGSWPAR